ncbi:MAG: transglutaminase [Burkholderiales bacterium 28-67-8]|nr:MAG: transglutaminase [Burkholderiales bacterium 28-67-8]
MPGTLHFETPTALEYFTSLVAEDASFSVLEAAVSIAQDEYPGLDTQAVLSDIDALADRLKRRIPADLAALQKVRLLNQYFFQELGFGGNVNNYYDPCNSYVHEVLLRRRGIPITLATIYVELALQIGLNANGVSFPGHFLVKVSLAQGAQIGDVVIDPFTGQSLSGDDLEDRLTPYRRSQALMGESNAPLSFFLQPAPARETLARMLRNLKEIHRTSEDWSRLLPVLDRLVVLLPHAIEERRDRALACMEFDRPTQAIADLEAYLKHRPDADDRFFLVEQLAHLRRDLPPRLY